ncbi:MAG: SAM-dependent methyltransferase [Myxococcota bacterium]|jgi:SAM-dependent methyltransferase
MTSTQPAPEFSGLKGRFFAWFLTSPARKLLEWKMGRPEARIFELLELEGHEQVLDAGCGSGFHTLQIAAQLPDGHVVATDVSIEMLSRLRRQAAARGLSDRIDAIEADNLALDLEDGRFDRAISAAVWHHLPDPDQAAAELFRTLRPGGRVVVCDLLIAPSEKAVAGLDGHDRAFEPDDMQRILQGAGFETVTVETIGRWIVGAGERPLR